MIFISCASKHVLRLCRHSYSARSNGVSKQDQPLDVATLLRHSDPKNGNFIRKLFELDWKIWHCQQSFHIAINTEFIQVSTVCLFVCMYVRHYTHRLYISYLFFGDHFFVFKKILSLAVFCKNLDQICK